MNNRVNYTVIGILVLVGIGLIIGFAYWMLRPADDEDVKKYAIYFNESVLGLNLDAAVKYRGISVGKVTQMKINPKNSEQVEVIITILKTTPVKEDTVAKLTAQGITGLTYINLSKGSHISKLLTKKAGEKYPVIKTIPSFFENFEKSLGKVSSRLSSTLGRTEELLGTANQEQMALLLKRSANVMEKMNKLLDDETIEHLQNTSRHMDSFSKKLDRVMPNVDFFIDKSIKWEKNISTSFASITESYLGITASMDEIKRAVASGEFNFKEISSDIVPTMNDAFLEMEGVMVELQETLKQYNESPSDILYKKQELKKAPGEK